MSITVTIRLVMSCICWDKQELSNIKYILNMIIGRNTNNVSIPGQFYAKNSINQVSKWGIQPDP